MKLYYVSGRYIPTGCRNARGSSGCVMAETEAEAIEKFKNAVTPYHREKMTFSASVKEDGIAIVHSF